MNTKQSTNIPIALSQARHQLDLWRSQRPSKRTRFPKEFWQQAVTLAKEHGLNKTARALNVKYYSLKKHLDQANATTSVSSKLKPEFIELLPGAVTAGCGVISVSLHEMIYFWWYRQLWPAYFA